MADYDAVVRPLALVYEAYVAMSDRDAVRQAKIAWERAVDDLDYDLPRNADRPIADLQAESLEARRVYDAAIEAAGDERVTAAKHLLDDAAIREAETFARRLP